jgi:hypothetical protein
MKKALWFSMLHPLDEKEIQSMADRYMPLLDPRFKKAVKQPINKSLVLSFLYLI